MDELQRALGAIISAVAMGFECLLWGGVDLARRVINRRYIYSVIAIGIFAVLTPLAVLMWGLISGSQGTVVFSGFLFLFLACIWYVAAVPATLLIGAGVEIKQFFKKNPPLAPAPVRTPAPAPTKKR